MRNYYPLTGKWRKKNVKKYRNSGRIQTESVKLYLLAVTEYVCLDKTNCIKVPAFLLLSLKIKEVMDTMVVTVGYNRQGAKLPIFQHIVRELDLEHDDTISYLAVEWLNGGAVLSTIFICEMEYVFS